MAYKNPPDAANKVGNLMIILFDNKIGGQPY